MDTKTPPSAAQHKFNIVCDLICEEEISHVVRGYDSAESKFNLRGDIRQRLIGHFSQALNGSNITLTESRDGDGCQIGWRVKIALMSLEPFEDIFYFPAICSERVASLEQTAPVVSTPIRAAGSRHESVSLRGYGSRRAFTSA